MAKSGWGGRREGAGRKPTNEKPGESHLRRSAVASKHPVHVEIKLQDELPSLRQLAERDVLIEAFRKGAERPGFRLVHYGILRDHLHFLVEAKNRDTLARGMQGLLIRIARALNRFWGRSGKVYADRYHDTVLKSPEQVRRALVVVLQGARKNANSPGGKPDRFTSGYWFDGWRERIDPSPDAPERPTVPARTRLLDKGWRQRGLISLTETPLANEGTKAGGAKS